jgi:hypothetical protein
MLTDLRILIAELKNNPMPTICGLLIACIIALGMHFLSEQKRHETKEERLSAQVQELNLKILTNDREWAKKFDEVRMEQIGEMKEALARQSKIESEQKRILKKVNQ